MSPARAGSNTLRVRFRDVSPVEVLVSAANEAAGVEPASRPMRRIGAGEFEREGPELAFAGVWRVEIQARVGDLLHFHADVPVRAR